MDKRSKNIVMIFMILVIGFFYLTTIREGHNWGDDFSMYIRHAINICEGKPYQETGYIYVPGPLSPKSYPPIFPLLLAPIYKMFGLNFTAMKVELIIIFLISLVIIYLTFEQYLGYFYTIIMLLIIGFNPFFWEIKDQVLSDLPFLLFTYLNLYIINKIYSTKFPFPSHFFYGTFLGVLIYIAYGIRTIGIVFIPTIFIYDIINNRKITITTILATTSCLLFVLLQKYLLGSQYYSDQLIFNIKDLLINVLANLYIYALAFKDLWIRNYFLPGILFFIIFTIIAILGYFKRCRESFSAYEIFFVLYMLILLLWPAAQGTRFLIPLIPLYIFYGLVAIKHSSIFNQKYFKILFFSAIIVMIFSLYGVIYLNFIDFGKIKEGISKKESIELFNYIKYNTDKNDIFIFVKPRALCLFTARRASYLTPTYKRESIFPKLRRVISRASGNLLMSYSRIFKSADTDNALIDYEDYYNKLSDFIKNYKIKYIIIDQKDGRILEIFISKNPNHFQKMYSNGDFILYKII